MNSEILPYNDPRTGCLVRQLTNHRGHSHHLYFTNPGWFDNGRRLLFGSDRMGRTNLFSVDLHSGQIAQHTDADMPASGGFQSAALNPIRPEVYFRRDRDLMAVDLVSNRERLLHRIEEDPRGRPFRGSMINVTSDGRFVCTSIHEDLSDRFRVDLSNGYIGFDQYWEAMPLSKILVVPVDGGSAREVFSERYWIGHVNTSPTQPNLMTFCHEGPWEKVDQRIWGLDLATGKTWPIRPRAVSGERIGHEYWLADGVQVGYHGEQPGQARFIGRVRFDNTQQVEATFPEHVQHIHSNTAELIVGDGTGGGRLVRLWRWTGNGYDGPRILCEHRCSAHSQVLHVHPRFSPDGTKVIFTSDCTGYGQVYEVEVPPFDSLPPVG